MARSARRTCSLLVLALTSVATLAAAPAQAAPPTPRITGAFQPGQVLTASPADARYAYRWLNCGRLGTGECESIWGATAHTYTPTMEDYGDRLKVRITDASGASATSALTVNIGRPVMLTRPVIGGDDFVLEATPGTWGPADTNPTVVYEWLRCDLEGSNCVAVTQPDGYWRYNVQDADWAKRMRVRVTATNRAGSTTGVSYAREAIGKPRIYNERPVILGAPRLGHALTLTQGTWSWASTMDAYAYTWLRCDSAGHACARIATGQTYTPVEADLGHRLRGVVAGTNEAGTTKASTGSTRRVGAPVSTKRPVISGTATVGATVTVNTGTWSPAGTSYEYVWELCWADCTGKFFTVGTGQSYAPTEQDANSGGRLRARVTASNQYGTTLIRTVPTAPVAPAG